MRSFINPIAVAALFTVGCYQPKMGEGEDVRMEESRKGDSNGDGVKDLEQSVGTGIDPASGEPFVVFFLGDHLPPYQQNLQWIGFGCSAYDHDVSDDWQVPCAPLSQYLVDGVITGYAFRGVREDIPFEGVPVDASSFTPYGGGWTDAAMGQKPGDDPNFFVRHVDGSSCGYEGESNATHYGFIRIDDMIVGLGESIAPPDPDCN